jgi:hypothetical protein
MLYVSKVGTYSKTLSDGDSRPDACEDHVRGLYGLGTSVVRNGLCGPERPVWPWDLCGPKWPVWPWDLCGPERPVWPWDLCGPERPVWPWDLYGPERPVWPWDLYGPEWPVWRICVSQAKNKLKAYRLYMTSTNIWFSFLRSYIRHPIYYQNVYILYGFRLKRVLGC